MSEKKFENAESLLKAVDDYLEGKIGDDQLDEEFAKSSDEEDIEKGKKKAKPFAGKETKEEEEAEKKETEKKAMKTKPGKKDEDDDDEEEEKKAKHDEEDEEEEKKCSSKAKKSLTDAEYEEFMNFKKAKEVEEKEALVKSISGLQEAIAALNTKVDTLSKGPATVRRSVDGLKVMEKGEEMKKSKVDGNDETVNEADDNLTKAFSSMHPALIKAKVCKVMLHDGLMKGKGIREEDISEYEFNSKFQNKETATLVRDLVNAAIVEGRF